LGISQVQAAFPPSTLAVRSAKRFERTVALRATLPDSIAPLSPRAPRETVNSLPAFGFAGIVENYCTASLSGASATS